MRVTRERAKALELAFLGRFDLNVQEACAPSVRSRGFRFVLLDHARDESYGYYRIRRRSGPILFSEIRSCALNSVSFHRLRVRGSVTVRRGRGQFTLVAAFISRTEKYLAHEGWDEPLIGVDEITGFLAWFVEKRRQARDPRAVIGLFSPTGWQEEAIAYVCGTGDQPAFSSPEFSLCLVGPALDATHFCHADETMSALASYFGGKTEAERAAECRVGLQEHLLKRGYVVLADFAHETGILPEHVRQACDSLLLKAPNCELVDLKGLGKTLRNNADKRLAGR